MDIVTGAAGHIGGNLVRTLLAQGRQVRAIVHGDRNEALDGLEIERAQADIRARDALDRAFVGADTVWHLAALISIVGDPDGRVHATNVDGARNVAEAALAAGCKRMVHFSSCHAFNLEVPGPLDETAEAAGPKNCAYDHSKALGGIAVREVIAKGLDAVLVHPAGVIGPNDFRPSRMGKALRSLRDGKMFGLVRGGFDWVDVRDVVAGALAAEAKGRTGESYLLGGHWLSVVDLLREASAVSGVPAPRFVSPMWLARFGAPFVTAWAKLTKSEPLFTSEALRALAAPARISSDKARKELGYEPRPMRETLTAVFDSFKALQQ